MVACLQRLARLQILRSPVVIIASSVKWNTCTERYLWFTFAQQASNFTPMPTAAFQFDQTAVKMQVAQLNVAFTQYPLLLSAGAVEPTSGFFKLQSAFDQGGMDQVLQE